MCRYMFCTILLTMRLAPLVRVFDLKTLDCAQRVAERRALDAASAELAHAIATVSAVENNYDGA